MIQCLYPADANTDYSAVNGNGVWKYIIIILGDTGGIRTLTKA